MGDASYAPHWGVGGGGGGIHENSISCFVRLLDFR